MPDPKATRALSIALFAVTWLALAVATLTITTEYYDGFEYILSGMHLWSRSPYWFPKVPLVSSFFALVYTPYAWSDGQPPLLLFHLASFALSTTYLWVTAKWIGKKLPWLSLPLPLVLGVAAWNELFIHYSPFSLTDIPATLCVALWFLVSERDDLDTTKGKLLRALALAAVALGRAQLVLLPAVDIAWRCWRTRELKAYALVIAASLIPYFAAFGIFFSLGSDIGFFDGIAMGVNFILSQASANAAVNSGLGWLYFGYLFRALTPLGSILAALGLYLFARGDRATREALAGPLLGGLLYFLFTLRVGHEETRYLMPLLPLFAVLQCVALAWLLGRKRAAGLAALLALFASIVPELSSFADPYYRLDPHRTAATRIAAWSRSDGAVFLRSREMLYIQPLYPRSHLPYWRDREFYAQDFAPGAFHFFTGKPFGGHTGPLSYSKSGYPIPDQIKEMAPPGITLLPPPESYPHVTEPDDLQPIYALRWWPKETAPAGAACSPKVADACVEVLSAFEGFRW
jgi:hypothetical protein